MKKCYKISNKKVVFFDIPCLKKEIDLILKFLKKSKIEEIIVKSKKENIEHLLKLIKGIKQYELPYPKVYTFKGDLFVNEKIKKKFLAEQKLNIYFLGMEEVVFEKEINTSKNIKDLHNILEIIIKDILYFSHKFFIPIVLKLNVSYFDVFLLEKLIGFCIEYELETHFNFQSSKNKKKDIDQIKEFLRLKELESSYVEVENFPLCWFNQKDLQIMYKPILENIKGEISSYEKEIKEIKNKKHVYLEKCKKCKRRKACYFLTNFNNIKNHQDSFEPSKLDTIVFVGGSLNKKDVETYKRKNQEVVFTKPAEQGDFFAVILENYKNVLLFDAYFYQKYSCTTLELLIAMQEGVNIIGSSSVGAMRAIELDNYGMIGSGYVYEYFKKQEIKPYHIVAQTYDNEDQKITIPLVEVIYFLGLASKQKIITKNIYKKLLSIANNIHFTCLSYPYFFKRIDDKIDENILENLKEFLQKEGEENFNIKRIDTLYVLNNWEKMLLKQKLPIEKIVENAKKKYVKRVYAKYKSTHDLTIDEDIQKTHEEVCKKFPNKTTSRARPIEETLKLAKEFTKDLDLIVADISKFDFGDQFVFNIVFPAYMFLNYYLSTSRGHGSNINSSLIGAYMELIERIPMTKLNRKAVKPPKEDTIQIFPYKKIPDYVSRIGTQNRVEQNKSLVTEYIKTTNILTGKSIYLSQLASYFISSDGNASGNTLLEAITYGIYEIMERDIWYIYSYIHEDYKQKLMIDVKDIKNLEIQNIIDHLLRKGLEVYLYYYPNVYNVIYIKAIITDKTNNLFFHGIGCRINLHEAIHSAITEGYQAYLVFYVGVRDDKSLGYLYKRTINKLFQNKILEKLSYIDYLKLSSEEFSVQQTYDFLVKQLKNNNIKQVFTIYNKHQNDVSLKDVKVIIPNTFVLSEKSDNDILTETARSRFYKTIKIILENFY